MTPKEMRDKYEIGLLEANKLLRGQRLRVELDMAKDLYDLSVVLQEIINDVYGRMPEDK